MELTGDPLALGSKRGLRTLMRLTCLVLGRLDPRLALPAPMSDDEPDTPRCDGHDHVTRSGADVVLVHLEDDRGDHTEGQQKRRAQWSERRTNRIERDEERQTMAENAGRRVEQQRLPAEDSDDHESRDQGCGTLEDEGHRHCEGQQHGQWCRLPERGQLGLRHHGERDGDGNVPDGDVASDRPGGTHTYRS